MHTQLLNFLCFVGLTVLFTSVFILVISAVIRLREYRALTRTHIRDRDYRPLPGEHK